MAIRRLDFVVCASDRQLWWQVRRRDRKGREQVIHHGFVTLIDDAENFSEAFLVNLAWEQLSERLWQE